MEPQDLGGVVQHVNEITGQLGSQPVEMVDVELVRRTKSGDVSAFEELFHRYQKRVYNIIIRLVSNEHDAADLTQEVFIKVYISIGKLRAEEAFFTWLKTVAINAARDHIRRRPPRADSLNTGLRTDDVEAELEVPDKAAGPEKLLLDSDKEQAIRGAVASLSDEHRIVVALHHIEGMDLRDIAKLLGCPVGTIKSRLSRARDELRRKLGRYVG